MRSALPLIEPGYTMGLFEALDCADIVAIDGCELLDRYQELSETRRRLRLGNEGDLTIDNQTIRIVSGTATFSDAAGLSHQVRFRVERAMQDEDILSVLS